MLFPNMYNIRTAKLASKFEFTKTEISIFQLFFAKIRQFL